MKYKILSVIGLFVLASGCVTAPEQATYLEARPAEDSRSIDPAIVKVPMPLPLPGQLKSKPNNIQEKPAYKQPWKVIEDANRSASQNPHDFGYFNSIMQFDFAPGALYQVYTAPLKLTDIQLQPGEKILGKPAAGDTVRWVIGVGNGRVEGLKRQHVYIKPTQPGLHTTLFINTDKRTYHIELHSYKQTYMAAVGWRYPHDELLELEEQIRAEHSEKNEVIATQVNIDHMNSKYKVKVIDGKPIWKPVNVFDDGEKTFIEFPKDMLNREAPALFVLSNRDETQLVNYRIKNHYYIVDRLFQRAELRVGQKKQDIVHIINQQAVKKPKRARKHKYARK